MAELKQVECEPKCGFLIRSENEKELIGIALKHGKEFHNMTLTENDIKKMMKSVKVS